MASSTPLVALIGRPNVGKSSLFNRLVGARQAITHETAGTTRDANYGQVSWGKHHFLLIDTAGMDDTKHHGKEALELAVQEQVKEVSQLADVLVLVVDAAVMITPEDQAAARLARKSGKPVVLAINKIDTTAGELGDSFNRLGLAPMVETSAVHGRGSGDLLDAICAHIAATPEPPAEPIITLALLGRPNVGKSSLLNAMAGKQQAIVSERAGTTRDVGSIDIAYHGQTIRILDTAGLRRRGKIEGGIEKYSSLRTLASIAQADICVVVMDATEPSVAGDQHIAGAVVEAGKGLILAVNKWDAVEKETGTQERFTRHLVHDFAFAHWAPLVYISATQGLNVTRIFEQVRAIAATREIKVPTAELNRVVERLIAKQPPAGLKNRRPKIKYATQTGTNPPEFTFFASYPNMIHFSYQRYLENGLREAFKFDGTPIQIKFRDK
ncbi:MAG TPA: ribosome biogenesis GTPase Der [Candidatus Saccharimonadales bacterium]|nr:ribosome biogenesis GTPase Der [Candidatus Saccharimonadales bacterium]